MSTCTHIVILFENLLHEIATYLLSPTTLLTRCISKSAVVPCAVRSTIICVFLSWLYCRILWKKNEVADYEATTFSIFYNNAVFLFFIIIMSFYVLKNFTPLLYPFCLQEFQFLHLFFKGVFQQDIVHVPSTFLKFNYGRP